MNNSANSNVARCLARAIVATRALDELGCLVQIIDANTLDRCTIHVVDLRGALRGDLVKTTHLQGERVSTYVSEIERCRVIWHMRESTERREIAIPADDDELPPCVGERMRDAAFDIARNGVDA